MYNRTTEPGIIQVVNLQTGRDLYGGRFTVNLGVWVQDIEELVSHVYKVAVTGITQPA